MGLRAFDSAPARLNGLDGRTESCMRPATRPGSQDSAGIARLSRAASALEFTFGDLNR